MTHPTHSVLTFPGTEQRGERSDVREKEEMEEKKNMLFNFFLDTVFSSYVLRLCLLFSPPVSDERWRLIKKEEKCNKKK